MEEILKKQIIDFIGTANYQGDDLGTYVWANRNDGSRELVAVVNGYNTETEKNEGKEVAELFQDELGKFIAEAINEKVHKELHKEYKFIDYDLSVRLLNCLKESELSHPIQLMEYKKEDIIKLRNFGLKSQDELFKFMRKYGYKFLGE